MISRRDAFIASLGALSILAATGVAAAAGAPSHPPSHDIRTWADETGRFDLARVPARVGVATGESSGGWVSSELLAPYSGDPSKQALDAFNRRVFPVFDAEIGGSIIGTFSALSGFVPKGGKPEAAPTVTTVIGRR